MAKEEEQKEGIRYLHDKSIAIMSKYSYLVI